MTPTLIDNITFVRAAGLMPPPWAPARPWPLWVECGTYKVPEVTRFAWCPSSGRLWAGAQVDHRLLLTRDERSQLGHVLLGYALPFARAVAVKGVYTGLGATRPSPLAAEATAAFVRLVRASLKADIAVYRDVNSPFLVSRFGGRAAKPLTC